MSGTQQSTGRHTGQALSYADPDRSTRAPLGGWQESSQPAHHGTPTVAEMEKYQYAG